MESLVGSESSSSSQDFSELGKPEGRYQLLLGKSFFYVPDTGGFQSGLKAFYELVDNGPMSGRALYMPKAIQKKWNVRFAVASVEHLPIEHAGDGWDRRCIPIPTIKSSGEVDAALGQKLSEELGEIAGWALSMDKLERDNILTLPVSNPMLLFLKQEGAIIGDGVKSFVDRCFVPGTETHYGSDLHSWYQAYCKAHALSPLSYQKFIQRLQRILSKQWRPSEVVWMDGKAKRQSACWEGLRVLPCFLDLALDEDDDNQPNSRPHIPNWICVKEKCQDGGLTDLTTTLQTLTPEKNAETIDLHTLPTLHTQSLRNAEIPHEMKGDGIEENKVSDESGSKVCKSRLTPTFEPVDDGCKVSKVCKADDSATLPQPPSISEEHQANMLADEMRKAIASANVEDAKEITKQINESTSQLRGLFWQNLERTEEKNKARLLAFANVSEGTLLKYVGKIEQYAQEELTAYDADGHGHITCLLPNGCGFTTWIPTRDLRLPKS
jgi:hypothetical protein